MRKPSHPAGDIRVDVAHAAPVLVRERRGDGLAMAAVPLVTPVTIRTVPFSAFRGVRLMASDDLFEDLMEFEGRFWRRAAADHRLDAVLASLGAREPFGAVRRTLDDLWLDPCLVDPSGGAVTGAVPDLQGPDRARVALDLTDGAASATAARFARDVVHAAGGLWIARDAPMLGYHRERVLCERRIHEDRIALYEADPRAGRNESVVPRRSAPRTLVSAADDHDRYLARLPKLSAEVRRGVRAAATRLGPQLADRERPLSDLAAFVRFQSGPLAAATDTVLRYKANDRPRLSGAPADEIKARLARVLPIAALASVDRVPDRDVPEAIDAMHDLAVHARRHAPRTGSYAIGALDTALAYVEEVARPRLAREPLPEADAEGLRALAM